MFAVELREQRVQERRLAGAHLAGEQHEPLARLHAVDERREAFAVRFAEIEERRVGRHLERAARESVMRVVHGSARLRLSRGRLVAARRVTNALPPITRDRDDQHRGRRGTGERDSLREAHAAGGDVRGQHHRRNRREHRQAEALLEPSRRMERAVERLHRDAVRRGEREAEQRTDREDQRAVRRFWLGRRDRLLEHTELLTLLARLHVARDARLQPLLAELLIRVE